jgi:hypothetical protein
MHFCTFFYKDRRKGRPGCCLEQIVHCAVAEKKIEDSFGEDNQVAVFSFLLTFLNLKTEVVVYKTQILPGG